MTPTLPPILVVDDEKNMRLTLRTVLSDEGYRVEVVESAEDALESLEQKEFLMVITDAQLGGMSGYQLLPKIQQRWPQMPTLMITAYATPKLAVEAIKSGAMDYLAKPFAPEELIHSVARCADRYRLVQENVSLRTRSSGEVYRLEQIIGECAAITNLRHLIGTVAPTNATVLILGESGTGKEMIAGCIHGFSNRREKNYVRINCAAIPEALLESELFGHERGAFTGALKQKYGRVEEANGGTIFLDEIGDMSRSLQAKLLRFLEDGSFTRVGGNDELKVDVRIIAATNRDIIQAIRENQFREDLFYRLNVVQFRPPALRERGADVSLLARHFLQHFCFALNRATKQLSKAAEQKLLSHSWPGNVRELRNVIERAVILETTDTVQAANLPDFQLETRLRKSDGPTIVPGLGLDEILASYEREIINTVLERNRFSINKTAEQLKMTRHALRYRMQRLNLSVEGAGEDEGESKA